LTWGVEAWGEPVRAVGGERGEWWDVGVDLRGLGGVWGVGWCLGGVFSGWTGGQSRRGGFDVGRGVLIGCGKRTLRYRGHRLREVCVEGREIAHLAGMSGLLWGLLWLCVLLLYILMLLGRLRCSYRRDGREGNCVRPILRRHWRWYWRYRRLLVLGVIRRWYLQSSI
jgi:hypothetical protein